MRGNVVIEEAVCCTVEEIGRIRKPEDFNWSVIESEYLAFVMGVLTQADLIIVIDEYELIVVRIEGNQPDGISKVVN